MLAGLAHLGGGLPLPVSAFSHVAHTKKRHWKCFWLIVALVLVAVFIYQSVLLIIQYLQFSKDTNIQVGAVGIVLERGCSCPPATTCSSRPSPSAT